MTIAARNVAVFKPSKELSSRLNGGSEDEAGYDVTTDVAQPSQGSEKVHGDKIVSAARAALERRLLDPHF